MKQEYQTPTLTNFGSIKDVTSASAGPRTCPDGSPKPPTGDCGHGPRGWSP